MSVLSVSEFDDMAVDKNGNVVPIANGAPTNVQVITLSGSSTAISTAFNSKTRFVRLCATADCHFVFDDSPTATTSHEVLGAGLVEYRGIDPENMGNKIAARTTA